MTVNSNLEAAWKYHNTSKHSYASVHNNPHFLDWANQPLPFKAYTTLDPLPLPRKVRQTGVAALSAIAESIHLEAKVVPDLEALAQLLYLTAGITRHRKYPGGDIYFRAAACTGALYEVEVYVVCGNLIDLEAGVYHFAPAEFALRRLRDGDYRSVLSEATGRETTIVHAPLTIICTCTYWRNAWKYQARTYRHFGWDNGTLLANLLAVATALGMPARLICGFLDADVNRLLDVDPEREVAYSLVALGHVEALAQPLPSKPRPSIWKRFRSLETRLCTQPCTRFTLPLRSIRPKRLRFGVVRRHWRTYRRQLDRSFNSTLIRIRKCLGIRSNRSSFDGAPHASLPKCRSSCDSSLPCWTGLLVVSQRTSWIPRGLS